MAVATTSATAVSAPVVEIRKRRNLGPIFVNGVLALICLIWTIPTIGLLVSSIRQPAEILNSGWWNVFPHQEWTQASTVQLTAGLDLTQPVVVNGTALTDDQLRAGVQLPDGTLAKWTNRRQRIVGISDREWKAGFDFTLSNYASVLFGQDVKFTSADGGQVVVKGDDMGGAFVSTLTVAIPATVIPILIAAFAAYGFAWMRFKGRSLMFGLIVALLVVPLQVALIPILNAYNSLGITGTYLALWLAHTGFGLPLATYLLYNYVSELPRDIFESAFLDGASHFTTFTRLILPLAVPALASFAIFQFLWVWNDYLVALVFLGGQPGTQVLTMRLGNMTGSRGQEWYLLTAGAFVSMILPLTVFFGLQRFFVRGLLAGSVKG